MKNICRLLVIVAVIAASHMGQGFLWAAEGDILAKVGDQEITRKMVDDIIATIPEENRVPFLTPDGRKKILDEVISFTLFAQAARKQGLDKEPAVRTRLNYAQTEYLAREFFRRRLAETALVSEAEIKDYYNGHRDEFNRPEEIKASHILVRTQAEAAKVLDKIKSGADFSDLAKKHSIDPAAAKGGRLELPDGGLWLPKGTFEASFEHALFKIPKGEVGGPIKTQFGWHVLNSEDRRRPAPRSYAEVRGMIMNRLEDEKRASIHEKVTEELRTQIPVVIN